METEAAHVARITHVAHIDEQLQMLTNAQATAEKEREAAAYRLVRQPQDEGVNAKLADLDAEIADNTRRIAHFQAARRHAVALDSDAERKVQTEALLYWQSEARRIAAERIPVGEKLDRLTAELADTVRQWDEMGTACREAAYKAVKPALREMGWNAGAVSAEAVVAAASATDPLGTFLMRTLGHHLRTFAGNRVQIPMVDDHRSAAGIARIALSQLSQRVNELCAAACKAVATK